MLDYLLSLSFISLRYWTPTMPGNWLEDFSRQNKSTPVFIFEVWVLLLNHISEPLNYRNINKPTPVVKQCEKHLYRDIETHIQTHVHTHAHIESFHSVFINEINSECIGQPAVMISNNCSRCR